MNILFLIIVGVVLFKLYSMILYNAILRAVLYPICNSILIALNVKHSMKYREIVRIIKK
jgi:hypothetical protein